ncbi:MAG: hypothetical protein FWH17_08615 [Oscillospiraceae bacterium]|nr:hypothetical protein [Oscillospiraceae bacterium]
MNAFTTPAAAIPFYNNTDNCKTEYMLQLPYDQKDTKPEIEDVICQYLDGNTLKNALDFISYIHASKMKIKWSAANVWSVKYKNKRVLDIIVRNDAWRVRLAYDHIAPGIFITKGEAEYIKALVGTLKNSMSGHLEPTPAMS